MKSIVKFASAVAAGLLCTAGVAMSAPVLAVPEPGSITLVGLAVAGLVAFSRKK